MLDLVPTGKSWFSGLIYQYCQRIDAAAGGKL
jgi:hypothetical protein